MSIIHIPFYPSDWLAGTLGLSDAEKGVYITLIARMYEMAAPIERNDDRLYRVCGSKSKASFVKSLDYLIDQGKIIVTEDGLFNEKVAKVIKQTTEKSDKAKAAAQSRWDRKPSKNNAGIDANASPEHMPDECHLELEPELYKKESTNVLLSDTPAPIDEPAKAISAYNEVAAKHGWATVQKVTAARRAAVKGRLKDAGGIDGWSIALEKAEASPFLRGERGGFKCSFDFLSKQANFVKLMEGNYDDRTNDSTTAGGTNQSRSGGAHHSLMAGFADVANRNR